MEFIKEAAALVKKSEALLIHLDHCPGCMAPEDIRRGLIILPVPLSVKNIKYKAAAVMLCGNCVKMDIDEAQILRNFYYMVHEFDEEIIE